MSPCKNFSWLGFSIAGSEENSTYYTMYSVNDQGQKVGRDSCTEDGTLIDVFNLTWDDEELIPEPVKRI